MYFDSTGIWPFHLRIKETHVDIKFRLACGLVTVINTGHSTLS